MSHVAYDLQWSDAMNDLQEQRKVEDVPQETNEQTGKANIDLPWTEDEKFQHLACLYIKYIDIFGKLEDCYDQMVHPQKRFDIKQILESTMLRVCEIKHQLIEHNPRTGSLYVHLDQLLFDLKYDPSIIEIPVPRYFAEKEDNIEVKVAIKEAVVRDGGAKKKGGAVRAKKKGKKKKKGTTEEVEEEKMTLKVQEREVHKAYKKVFSLDEPDIMQEMVHDIFYEPRTKDDSGLEAHKGYIVEMDMNMAIRLIQTNERGRQGIYRIQTIRKIMKKQKLEKDMQKKIRMGRNMESNQQQKEAKASEFLQRHMRGILARQEIEGMRAEEMVFLGMQRPAKTQDEVDNDPVSARKNIKLKSKMMQLGNQERYEAERKELLREIMHVEGYDIKDVMLKERRDWVYEQKSLFGKIPADLEKFNEEQNKEGPTPEEMAAMAAAAELEAQEKKTKKDGAGKKNKKKKKGKGGTEPVEKEETGSHKIGPNELVRKFDDYYDDFQKEWATRDEHDNPDQKYDKLMARKEVMPSVSKGLLEEVDNAIKQELDNMRALAGVKVSKRKKKGKKGKKTNKKKKEKKIKLPGGKALYGIDDYTILKELIACQICKYLPPACLVDFLGEFNYIHSMLDNLETTPFDPSMALIRQLVTEYVVFPLGSELIRKRHPGHVRSVMFYGPEGTGKTLMVRAVANETKSVVFDLSPVATMGLYSSTRAEGDAMVAKVMKAAKGYQPSIIYIDECEKIWPTKKKKGKKGGKKKGGDANNPSRIKKTLTKWRNKWITDDTRITIIGCTSVPHEGSKKEFRKFFDRSIYFPFPDYTTSRQMWKAFIEDCGGKMLHDFPLNTLAHISMGYSAGSIRKTVEFVLTPYRRSKLDDRPLKMTEFIGPLSQCANTMEDQYDDFKTFTDYVSGDQDRRKKIEKMMKGDDVKGDDAKKGKKKKKQK